MKKITRRKWIIASATTAAFAQTPKPPPKFKWINSLPSGLPAGVKHAKFHSAKNGVDVGYAIYLPPDYEKNASRRYPVVYYLHGGRPGGENRSVRMASYVDKGIRAGSVPPMIYVFNNGGEVSHYDYPALKSWGAHAITEELIPHIDRAYRTIAARQGRGIEGFSQGGRGTARLMFARPDLFVSAAPMGGGHQHEKHISEHNGKEDGEPGYLFEPKYNTYDLARKFREGQYYGDLSILIAFGTKDFNYEANLEWMKHLDSLGIAYRKIIAQDVPHSAAEVYDKIGDAAIKFHADTFRRALGKGW